MSFRLLDALDASAHIQFVHGGEKLYRDNLRASEKIPRPRFSLHRLRLVRGNEGIRHRPPLTGDRHFRVLGFNPLLASQLVFIENL